LLADRTRGEVITPSDPSYDRARSLFNGMLDRRPRLVFRPIDISDLVAGVRSASEPDLPIAVRGGGHSVAGHAMPDGGFVIDMSRWRSAMVDPERQVAEAQGGCLLMDLDVATSAHGLAVPSGTFLDTVRIRRHSTEVEFNEETLLWDDEDDGGLAASRVPLRPPDHSGSESAALVEPTDPRDIPDAD
jgi:hypothetical protein